MLFARSTQLFCFALLLLASVVWMLHRAEFAKNSGLAFPAVQLPHRVDSRSESSLRPQRRTFHRSTWIGAGRLDLAHDLFIIRGLVFCNRCGFIAAQTARKLRRLCGDGLLVCPTPQGQDYLTRHRQGLLPKSTPA